MFEQRSELPSAVRWRAHEQKTGLLAALVLGIFTSYLALYLGFTIGRAQAYPFGDFFALWSSAKFVLSHAAAEIYDPVRLHAAQVALGMNPADQNPFPYPPSFLLILGPLGYLPYGVACAIWVGGSLLFYVWALLPRQKYAASVFATVVAPTTTLTIVFGQSGFLSGALLIGGFRVLQRRPMMGGLLLGLLTFKPQLGILVPIALISARSWRGIVAASATALALAAVTSAMFGWTIWGDWLASLPGYSRQFDVEGAHRFMPTITATLQVLGATPSMAWLVQAVAAICVATITWSSFREGITPLATAALFVGTYLATPHAFIYDLPSMTGAVLYFIRHRLQSDASFLSGEIAILLMAMTFPVMMVWIGPGVPIGVLSEVLLLSLIVTEQRSSARRTQSV